MKSFNAICKRACKRISLIALTCLMVACVSDKEQLNNNQIETLWHNQQVELKKIQQFQANGSLAYISGKTRNYARFSIFQSNKNEFQLKVSTPIGTHLFTITSSQYLAEFVDNQGNRYTDENVERLISRLAGMDLPLSTLNNWLIGLSDSPNNDILDNQGHLNKTKVTQNGLEWLLTINKYTTVQNGRKQIDLPTDIVLNQKEQKVRIKIDKWKLY
ncbi:lipoprotein insertase outer membrane protein LolB [Orbaceae bacterium ac157xtp]